VEAAPALISALRRAARDLTGAGRRFALVGGLAVAIRGEPRFTRDVDLAVAVEDDSDAEALIADLGYPILASVEHDRVGRLATIRLRVPGFDERVVVLDLLFASSGIEREVIDASTVEGLGFGVRVPVATRAHLIALKILSERDLVRAQDQADLMILLANVEFDELEETRRALAEIEERGYARGKRLQDRLHEFLDARGA